MDLEKYFSDSFATKCLLTNHALLRINERFMYSELSKLRYLVQAAMRRVPFHHWKSEEDTAIVDSRFNFGIVCNYEETSKIIKIITFIRGKTPTSYKDCKTIEVSILKEKADQEVEQLNQLREKIKEEKIKSKRII